MADHIPAPIRVAARATTGTGQDTAVHLCWSPRLPCAVTVEILDPTTRRWQPWLLARDLLARGMAGPAGDGDAHLEPFPGIPGCPSDLLLSIGHPASRPRTAHFLITAGPVSRFLADTYRQIPPEAELVEVPAPEFFAAPGGGDRV